MERSIRVDGFLGGFGATGAFPGGSEGGAPGKTHCVARPISLTFPKIRRSSHGSNGPTALNHSRLPCFKNYQTLSSARGQQKSLEETLGPKKQRQGIFL